MSTNLSRICTFILASFMSWSVAITSAHALVANETVKLTPHRAVYDMALEKSKPGSGVSGIRGRMVFEFTGSTCEGYTLNMRLVTQITDRQGRGTLTDMRSSTWEQGEGKRFRFNSSQYLDQKLSEVTTGDAARKKRNDQVNVILRRPAKSEMKLPSKVLFPTQHSKILLSAANEGKKIVQASVYDGSEKGKKIYETTAFIGKAYPPGSNKAFSKVKNATPLDKLMSWPIALSYFDSEKDKEAVPTYQISFRLFSNGVSRKLLIDYGDFSIRGALKSIEFLKVPVCK